MSFNSLGGNVVDKHRSTGAGSSFSADLDDIALSGPTAMGELCCPCDGSSGDAAVAARAAVDDEGNGAWRIALDFQLCGAAERAPVPSPEQADAVALANFRAQMSGAGSKRRRRVSSSAGQTVEKAGWVALCVKNKEKDKARKYRGQERIQIPLHMFHYSGLESAIVIMLKKMKKSLVVKTKKKSLKKNLT
jgi:hypothetical protein